MRSTLRTTLILASAALVLLAAPAAAQSLPDLKGRTIKAVTENGYAPFDFKDPSTGKGVGFDYDLVTEIARRLNAKVSWTVGAWNTLLSDVHDGRFDLAADGITITTDRKELVDFTDPYLVSQQLILARAEEARFAGPTDLGANAKLLLGAQAGSAAFYAAAYNVLTGDEKSPRIKTFDTVGRAVKALLSGDVDCVLAEATAARGYVAANASRLKIVGDAFAKESLALVLTPGSTLTAAVNLALKAMRDDGTIDRLATKWLYLYGAQ
jgi:polar amino acid transport system substrate-binding protein